MKKIQILDCTLRDGGYCNKWQFGKENIIKVLGGLDKANIDIVECGYISDGALEQPGSTLYRNIYDVERFMPAKSEDRMYVVMINHGDYDVNKLPLCENTSIDGIRLAFHKKDFRNISAEAELLKKKGYKVFLQPMVTMNYSGEELDELIHIANTVKPYAFYIVDSFGSMKKNELETIYDLLENKLKEDIIIGFHSHNNLQLSYSNAVFFLEKAAKRDAILDSSVYGMGRGAGNLHTELIVEYLNRNYGGFYNLKSVLSIMDEVINDFFQRKPWGYSLPGYLSATYNIHPNYASFLEDKKTLTYYDMDNVLSSVDIERGNEFDKEYIEQLYVGYMNGEKDEVSMLDIYKSEIMGKTMLLIAPGKTSGLERDKIISYVKENDVVVTSINFKYEFITPDYIFVSNRRRYRELDKNIDSKIIMTSNIPGNECYLKINYGELLNNEEAVRDNAGLIFIEFLKRNGIKNIILAGFDGYSHDYEKNYYDDRSAYVISGETLDLMNEGMRKVLLEIKKTVNITFLTTPHHIKL